ncbi:expressed unknown protein [Seminavis robusta]|uniref:Uncharacterized protein n=1 Tax=Seminavis robusta TaxID=568900 RepID=A0A9N8HEW6_9STRA|nr:expressed unknown protein [Seminavis robusta]|eukprot:Sro429_g141090.1 n/a (161) ;mRNA; f:34007-34575
MKTVPFFVLLVCLLSFTNAESQSIRKLQPPVEFLGENPEPLFGVYPLKMCQGDCDKNEHCDTGLVCMMYRKAYEAVPGCAGGESDGTTASYCIQDTERERNSANNGAEVVSVNVKPAEGDQEKQTAAAAAAESENSESSASSNTIIVGLASFALVMGLLY